MGQLFNRIKNFVASEFNNKESIDNLSVSDSDLEDIVNKLNNYDNNSTQDNFKSKTEKTENSTSTQQHQKLSLSEAYQVLEIDSNLTNEQIKKAYYQKIKEYHPDKVHNLGKDLRELAEQKTIIINEAYEIIKIKRNF
jgi:DnaJ-domain-containing protein 1